jgi:hypothetical protein
MTNINVFIFIDMINKYRTLLINLPVRHVIVPIKNTTVSNDSSSTNKIDV